MREKNLVVSDLKRKNRAQRQSAMSELLSKSNTTSTGKNESVKRSSSGGRIYMQPSKAGQINRQAIQNSKDSSEGKFKNVQQPVRAAARQIPVGERTAAKSSDRRTIKTSIKVVHAVVTTAVLLCICTGIISAVLILNPSEENGVSVDATIGVSSVTFADVNPEETEIPENTEEIVEDAALPEEPMLLVDTAAADTGRYTVTFTFYDRESLVCTSEERTVGELADLMGIEFSDAQRENVDTEAAILSDTVVSVDAVTYDTVAVNEPIPYETRYVDIQTIPKGTTKTHQKGANGTLTTEYQVTYVNGIEVERAQTNVYTSVAPTENVVYRGVGGTLTVGGKTYSYSYYIDCNSTVYTGGGTTASGLPATEKVIAVDPKIIPLGTTCYISGSYCEVGFRTAADVGGGIKGNIVDIYFEKSNPYFAGYGRRNVRVYIFN